MDIPNIVVTLPFHLDFSSISKFFELQNLNAVDAIEAVDAFTALVTTKKNVISSGF